MWVISGHSKISLARAGALLYHHLHSNHHQLQLCVAPLAPESMTLPFQLQLLLVYRREEEEKEGGCISPHSQERGGPSETQSFSSKALLEIAHSYQTGMLRLIFAGSTVAHTHMYMTETYIIYVATYIVISKKCWPRHAAGGSFYAVGIVTSLLRVELWVDGTVDSSGSTFLWGYPFYCIK